MLTVKVYTAPISKRFSGIGVGGLYLNKLEFDTNAFRATTSASLSSLIPSTLTSNDFQLRLPLPCELDKSNLNVSHGPITDGADTVTIGDMAEMGLSIFTVLLDVYGHKEQSPEGVVHSALIDPGFRTIESPTSKVLPPNKITTTVLLLDQLHLVAESPAKLNSEEQSKE
jgi:hypothetical protein